MSEDSLYTAKCLSQECTGTLTFTARQVGKISPCPECGIEYWCESIGLFGADAEIKPADTAPDWVQEQQGIFQMTELTKHKVPEDLRIMLARALACPGVTEVSVHTSDGKTWHAEVVAPDSEGLADRIAELTRILDQGYSVRLVNKPGLAALYASGDDPLVISDQEIRQTSPALHAFVETIQSSPGSLVEVRKVSDVGYTVTTYNADYTKYWHAEQAYQSDSKGEEILVLFRNRCLEPPPGFLEKVPEEV